MATKDKEFTSGPLNHVRGWFLDWRYVARIGKEHRMGPLSAADKEELATWFASMATNTDPDKVLPVPDCYKPVAAWLQMHGNDMVNESNTDVKPWSMPQSLIEYWADVWYANRVGMLRAFKLQKDAHDEAHDMPSGMLLGIHNDPKKGIGRA